MTKSAQHRRNAQECRVLARAAQNEQHRAQLIRMAEAWDDFAQQAERTERANQQLHEQQDKPADA